jgi:hypothetical protein
MSRSVRNDYDRLRNIMHVPEHNLPRYRRLIALARHVDSIGNKRSNRGDYGGANRAWGQASKISAVAQQLRVPGWRELGDQPPKENSA